MFKSAIVLIIISVVAMFFQSELGHILRYLLTIHDKIADGLAVVFSNAPAGRVIQETIALIIIPVVVGALAALVWLLIKRNEMPHLMTTVWIIWTILLVAVLSQPSLYHGNNQHAMSSTQQTAVPAATVQKVSYY